MDPMEHVKSEDLLSNHLEFSSLDFRWVKTPTKNPKHGKLLGMSEEFRCFEL